MGVAYINLSTPDTSSLRVVVYRLVLPSAGTFHALAASLLRTHMWGQGHGQLRILSKVQTQKLAELTQYNYQPLDSHVKCAKGGL